MEVENQLVLESSEPEKYSKELEVAVRAVQMACLLCQRVQDSLICKNNGQVHSKDDNSPVTIADICCSSRKFYHIPNITRANAKTLSLPVNGGPRIFQSGGLSYPMEYMVEAWHPEYLP
ncbi:3'(2'),5'-bisphosphate nucleotidase [Sarracenia purpurea var. burkii]